MYVTIGLFRFLLISAKFSRNIYIYIYINNEKHNVISDQQCGFHRGVSTNIDTAKFIKEMRY